MSDGSNPTNIVGLVMSAREHILAAIGAHLESDETAFNEALAAALDDLRAVVTEDAVNERRADEEAVRRVALEERLHEAEAHVGKASAGRVQR